MHLSQFYYFGSNKQTSPVFSAIFSVPLFNSKDGKALQSKGDNVDESFNARLRFIADRYSSHQRSSLIFVLVQILMSAAADQTFARLTSNVQSTLNSRLTGRAQQLKKKLSCKPSLLNCHPSSFERALKITYWIIV